MKEEKESDAVSFLNKFLDDDEVACKIDREGAAEEETADHFPESAFAFVRRRGF